MEINYYKEQLLAKEDMFDRANKLANQIQELLTEQNQFLMDCQQHFTESIDFTKLIQDSILPDVNILKIFFNGADYKIKQQISIGGDTLFIKNTNGGVVFGLLDATGHGIPAAMLSISGSLIINEITSTIEIEDPAVLLKLLSYRLHKTFNSHENSVAHFEGTAFFYSSKHNTLSYSSAKGKAFLLNLEGEIIPLATTKACVGEYSSSEFDRFELPVQKGEKLLLYSDGLVDQFGGERDKKFTTSRLRKLLLNNLHKNVSELIEIIYQEHLTWKGTTDQTDDISFKLIEF